MTHILVNLKRFDIPAARGGVNRLADVDQWAATIVRAAAATASEFHDHDFTFFFPELHLLPAIASRTGTDPRIGCQSVFDADVSPGGNFGAFTAQRTGIAMASAGVEAAMVGHSEERAALMRLYVAAGADAGRASALADGEVNARARAAQSAGLRTVVCVGEPDRATWQESLDEQLSASLDGLDPEGLIVAYEPIWAIGPGKTPPDRAQIREVTRFVKGRIGALPLVYGGGLKAENAADIASVSELDGGLIALTRFAGEIGYYPDEFREIVSAYVSSLEGSR